MSRRIFYCVLLVLFLLPASDGVAETYGKKKKGLKGRYLVINDGVDASKYRGATVIVEPTEVQSDKNKEDDEIVRLAADEMLWQRLNELKDLGVFDRVVSTDPGEMTDDKPILRLKPNITLQYGSKTARALVGMGAGKSKTIIRIEIFDGRSGDHIGYFNGYGSGSAWFVGGSTGAGVSTMAQDDIEESFNLFVEYCQVAVPAN